MTVTIWIDGRQTQCCGESFRPGDVVEWQVVEADAEDHADVVGAGRAAEIDFREERHGGAGEEGASIRVKVEAVVEVHCRYEVAGDGVGYPVPGSTELVSVERADGWAAERPGATFCGYLVAAEPVAG
ncbi:DUF6578 domain-containing protein [Streptomyces albidoflavus]